MSDPYAASPQPYVPGGLCVAQEGTHGPPSPPPQPQQPAYGYGQVPVQSPPQPQYGAPAPQQQQMGAPSAPGAAYAAPSPYYGGAQGVPSNMFAPEHAAMFQQQQLQQQQMYAMQAQQQPGYQPPSGQPVYAPPAQYGSPAQGAYAPYGQGNPNQPFLGANPNGPPPVPVLNPTPMGRVVSSGLEYQADANGEMRLVSEPDAMMKWSGLHATDFMCPFPFFCMGCCLSSTIHTLFSDKTQTITVDSYPGLCACLAEKKTIPFNDVGNVTARRGNMVVNGQHTFTVSLQTKHGEQVALTNADTMSEIGPKAAGVHAYLFGRGNPNYQPPNLLNMLLGI